MRLASAAARTAEQTGAAPCTDGSQNNNSDDLYGDCSAFAPSSLSWFYIPTFAGVPPLVFDLSALSQEVQARLAVIAGHFDWGVWNRGQRGVVEMQREEEAGQEGEQEHQHQHPACFVMLRSPVARVASYYNERVRHLLNADIRGSLLAGYRSKDEHDQTSGTRGPHLGPHLSELSALELDVLLRSFVSTPAVSMDPQSSASRSSRGSSDSSGSSGRKSSSSCGLAKDEGMSNALARMLSGASYRRRPHARTHTKGNNDSRESAMGEAPRQPDAVPVTLEALDVTAKRLSSCVIGLVEEMAATRCLLSHWFPWLRIQSHSTKNPSLASNTNANLDLPQEHLVVINAHNRHDAQLYRLGVRRFHEQLAALAATTTERH
jgi:hypothetical protein